MLRKISIATMLCIAAAGCSQQGEAPKAAQGTAATNEAGTSGKVVLADGYTPPFALRLRSQRHQPSAGKFRHVVAAEFKDLDAKAAVDKLSADLAGKGYKVDPAVDHSGGVRLGAQAKGAHMTLDVYGPAGTTLKYPGSQGLIYVTWVDRARR